MSENMQNNMQVLPIPREYFENNDSPLKLAEYCNGHYKCPKDPSNTNKRLGPLVGYAGTYEYGGKKLHCVGEEYVDFSKIEEQPFFLSYVASELLKKVYDFEGWSTVTGFVAPPEGGKALAAVMSHLSTNSHKPYLYLFPEKVVVRDAQNTGERPETELVFKRHDLHGGTWIIVEDVVNKFSTTQKLIKEINERGGRVAAVVCYLNRSPRYDELFIADQTEYCEDQEILDLTQLPIISMVRKVIPEYSQDDLYVRDDVKNGNIIWKPKDCWSQLMQKCKRHLPVVV